MVRTLYIAVLLNPLQTNLLGSILDRNDLGQLKKRSPTSGVLSRVGKLSASLFGLLMAGGLCNSVAWAADDPAAAGIKVSGHVEAGITVNTNDPSDDLNFGHLFTDRSNELLLNQAMLTVERPIDPTVQKLNVGFRLQGMFGSDSRYTHFLGELDDVTNRRSQFDIVEANVQTHLPILTSGGIDVKVGQYVTLEGAEVIDATGNFFYSHTYIFNFGIPFKHTGIMTTTHLNKNFDLYLGADSGVNTTFGHSDNNGAAAFHGGVGFRMFNGAVSVLATTHIGPEIARGTAGVRPNKDLRYLNDITAIWTINKKLTSTTDLNYIRDDGFDASGGGVAQSFAYTINDVLSAGIRGEVWRDSKGFFVGAFPGNRDFVNAEKGLPATIIGYGPTTYAAITAGVNLKFKASGPLKGLTFRPEVRYDWTLNSSRPFSAGTRGDQVTLGLDGIVSF